MADSFTNLPSLKSLRAAKYIITSEALGRFPRTMKVLNIRLREFESKHARFIPPMLEEFTPGYSVKFDDPEVGKYWPMAVTKGLEEPALGVVLARKRALGLL